MKHYNLWETILDIAKNTPSGANGQPWAAQLQDDRSLLISIDQEMALSIRSYEYLAAFLSIGALSYNVATVAEAMGYATSTSFVKDKNDRDSVKVTLENYNESRLNPSMVELVKNRCTNRKPTVGKIPKDYIEQLQHDFQEFIKNNDSEELSLNITREPVLMENVCDILSQSEELRIRNIATKTDLFSELKCHEADFPKKIALKTLEFPWFVEKMMCLMVKVPFTQRFFSAKVFKMMIKHHLLKSSDLACIFGPEDSSPKQLIKAGRVIQYLWLKNTQYGYSIQPWASLPFFGLEKSTDRVLTFPEPQQKIIDALLNKLSLLFNKKHNIPLFIFRLHDAPLPKYRSSKKKIAIQIVEK